MNKISLNEAKAISLLDRIETKYVCSTEQLSSLLDIIDAHYFTVMSDNNDSLEYCSLYYDTKDRSMYNDQINKLDNRQKIRVRKYQSGDMYIEIKNKIDNKITKKIRKPISSFDIMSRKKWLGKRLFYDFDDLQKTLYVKYNRVTLISKDYQERITIDSNISFHNYITNIDYSIDDIVIEVKHNDGYESYIENVLSSMNIYKKGFSKYRIGIETTQKRNGAD